MLFSGRLPVAPGGVDTRRRSGPRVPDARRLHVAGLDLAQKRIAQRRGGRRHDHELAGPAAAANCGPVAKHRGTRLNRFSPVVVLILAGALVLAVDAAIFVAPNALADPAVSARPSVSAAVDPPTAIAVVPSPTTFFDDPTFAPATTANAFVPTIVPDPTATPSPTASPKPKVTSAPYRDTVWNARTYVKNRVGAAGYNCINKVWTAESKWNPRAGDPSGAYGIPQAKPGTKMAAFGSNWRYSPLTQVKWGLWYVIDRYDSACGAYNFWRNHGWY